MKRFISILTHCIKFIMIILISSCARYSDNQDVVIRLNNCKGTVISINELERVYKVRYVDKNGVFHTEQFEENEIMGYVPPIDSIR